MVNKIALSKIEKLLGISKPYNYFTPLYEKGIKENQNKPMETTPK